MLNIFYITQKKAKRNCHNHTPLTLHSHRYQTRITQKNCCYNNIQTQKKANTQLISFHFFSIKLTFNKTYYNIISKKTYSNLINFILAIAIAYKITANCSLFLFLMLRQWCIYIQTKRTKKRCFVSVY